MSQESLLDPLLDLIISSVSDMKSDLKAHSAPEPWLDKAELHPWDVATPPLKYWHARRDLLASLHMMIALVQNPKERIACDSLSVVTFASILLFQLTIIAKYHHPIALNVVCKAGIPDILAKDDVNQLKGMPVNQIAEKTGINVVKLDRIMRFLSSHHIFEERSPSRFANNRLSRVLRTDSEARGFPIFMGGAGIKGAPITAQLLLDPVRTHSFDSSQCGFARAHRQDQSKDPLDDSSGPEPVFAFLGNPVNSEYLEGFGKAMATLENANGKGGYLDFDWARFDTEGAVIADIGSGVGHVALSILPALKHAKIINYDLAEVCETGKKFFSEHAPTALASGKVSFSAINFFEQAPKEAGLTVYILSNILHDWDDERALKILENVTSAMTVDSRLLVLEILIVPTLSQHGAVNDGAVEDGGCHVVPPAGSTLRDRSGVTPIFYDPPIVYDGKR